MKNKSYAVIGLGQFGMTVALTLAEANCDVLAIDDKDDNVQDIAEKVSYAVKADVRDPGILESLGVQNVDVAVIAVAENMEASITATMQVKELGVPFVMAKAMNSLHGRILEKIGAPRDWISKVYVSEALSGDAELMAQVEKLPYEIVADSVFRQMSDTQTPQGIMTVLKKPSYIMEDILGGKNPLVMILEDLQDPGNAGTILRTGEGAGVSGVLLTKTCVDITNPKVIRSTMGSVYRMPFLYVESVVSLAQELKDRNIRTFAAHLHGKNSYDQESYTGGTAFLIGNEGKGLTDEAADSADCLIRIPMCGKVESLNAAIASGILMYEAARQRR